MRDETALKADRLETAEIMRVVEDTFAGGRETAVRIAIFRMRHDDPIGQKVDGGRDNAPLLIQRRDLKEIGRIEHDLDAGLFSAAISR